jgi:predicted tellurium resistance membrane protein TerC
MFHQTFELHDLLVICLLVVLEGMLSMDNALVLGLLAKRLPEAFRAKALTYGLVGALVFRVLAIGVASALLRWRMVELLGGLYLLYVAIKHLFGRRERQPLVKGPALNREGQPILCDEITGLPLTEEQLGEEMAEQTHGQIRNREQDYSEIQSTHELGFWMAVASIEFTDVVFAIDSILAAIALVGPAPRNLPRHQLHPKLWVVILGGMGGVVLMRFAAMIFVRLLEHFPRFEISAYLMVLIIGAKMTLEYFVNPNRHLPNVDFNSPGDPGAWIFWGLIVAAMALGFTPGGRVKRRLEFN